MPPLGVIHQLARYPVKSLRGEALPHTKLTLKGLPEDRRYAFVQAASRSDFPWLTAREMPDLLRYRTSVENAGTPEVSVTVISPDGEKWPVASEELRKALEARSGRALFLLRDHRGCYDAAPLSLITRQSVARIAEESGTAPDPWRFRPNLLVDRAGGTPFEELNWVGRILRLGAAARIAVIKPDKRCMMITLDPETVEASPSILRSVVQRHQQYAGVYATVLTPGEVRVGDEISLET
jgi:MOSC domain-containing protein